MATTYGTFRHLDGAGFDDGRPRWLLTEVPADVMQFIRRVFPRARTPRAGTVELPDTLELSRDLRWLFERNPMSPADATCLAHLEARATAYERERETQARILSGHHADYGWREPARKPRAYQLPPAEIVHTTGRLLLADDVGLGKTMSSLLVLRNPDTLPALVVTLASIPGQWHRELQATLPWLRGHVIASKNPYDVAGRMDDGGGFPDVLFISYNKLYSWCDHLAEADLRTIIFDEMQELRRGELADKGVAAAIIAERATYRMGLSVGPDSVVELVGGPFGAGWVGRIEDATAMVEQSVPADLHGTHEIFRVDQLGISSRGWTGGIFAWKSVKSFVRHPCTSDLTTLRSGSGDLVLTAEHSVYRVGAHDLELDRADAIAVGDRLAYDNGQAWQPVPERPVDVAAIAADLAGGQVVVDLTGVTRRHLGAHAWQWQNVHREATHGTRLPAAIYRRHAHLLPPPAAVYVSAGRGGRRVDPTLYLSRWAYVLGFYLGDGWTETPRTCFAVQNKRIDEFVRAVGQLAGADIDITVSPKPGARVEIRVDNPLVAEVIRRATGGSGRRSKTSIPGEWIISWPEQARRDLLRGLLDSDGHTSSRAGRRCYVTVSQALATSLLSLLRSLGVPGSMSVSHLTAAAAEQRRQLIGPRYTVTWSADAEQGPHDGHQDNRSQFRWTRGRLHEAPVRATPSTTEAPPTVFDLEMDGHPSFVANGLLVHNTATPVYNYGVETYNVLSILDPDLFGTREDFNREWVGDASKGKVADPKALGSYIRDQGIVLRRTRKQVGRELPEAIRVEQAVETDHEVLDTLAGNAEAMARLVLDRTANREDRFRAAGQLDHKIRQATGIAKAPFVAEFVRLLLQSEPRVVLFGWHREVYDIWLAALREFRPVLYTGTETLVQKEQNAKAFLDGQSRVLLMSLRSGVGLDGLQNRCKVAVFGELDWTPGIHHQAIGRLHRDGQKEPVVAYFMISDDGSDPPMAEVLNIKRQQAEPIVNPDVELFEPASDAGVDRIRALASDFLKRRAATRPPGPAQPRQRTQPALAGRT